MRIHSSITSAKVLFTTSLVGRVVTAPRVCAIRFSVVHVAVNLVVTLGVLAGPVDTGARAQGRLRQRDASSNGVAPRLAVAWNDSVSGPGVLRAMSTSPPWAFETPPLGIGPDSVLRFVGGRVYVVSRADGTVAVVAQDTWTMLQVYSIGSGSDPLDIAVVSPELAYVTRRTATHLLRLDLDTGASTEVVDLGVFADPDGVPDMGMTIASDPAAFTPSAMTRAMRAVLFHMVS